MAQMETFEAAAPPAAIPKMLVVSADFPPRIGGVQRYVHDLVRSLPPGRAAVLAPRWRGCREFDDEQGFPVYRYGGTYLAPVSDAAKRVRSLVRETGAELVLFGHALPLGALGPGLAEEGVPYATLTHGAEAWMARVPGIHRLLRRALSRAEVVFAVSRYTERFVRLALAPEARTALLPPGVDIDRFHPSVDGSVVRKGLGIEDRPLVVSVSRLVARKGQDVLIRAWPRIQSRVPGATLLVVGRGPHEARLRRMAAGLGVAESVRFVGQVGEEALPAHFAAGDLFAMPTRTRRAGLEVEGFGIVYLEAAAAGKAVVAGDSGGAAEAVVDGQTGIVAAGHDTAAVAEAVVGLLLDEVRAARMAVAGRRRAVAEFSWPRILARFADALRG